MKVIKLPKTLNAFTCFSVVDGYRTAFLQGSRAVGLDFSTLAFVNPAGAVSLANIMHYFRMQDVATLFINTEIKSAAISYLNDAGFFYETMGSNVGKIARSRTTTVQFTKFEDGGYMQYLLYDLCPWIKAEVSISDDTLETIRSCLEEVFHNVQYHSGVATGFALAQHFPQKNQIEIAIGDYGKTIPVQVRKIKPKLEDGNALWQACQEGFTTKSNVRNRGAGLHVLINYVTARNSGKVEIRSAKGYISATPYKNSFRLTPSVIPWVYPGTLVTITLRTDTLERLEDDVKQEDFSWS